MDARVGLGGFRPFPPARRCTSVPASAHLVRVGHGADMRSALLRRGIAVRDCVSLGRPRHSRVAVRTTGDRSRLIEALREVLAR